jgi:hypothetical protein
MVAAAMAQPSPRWKTPMTPAGSDIGEYYQML